MTSSLGGVQLAAAGETRYLASLGRRARPWGCRIWEYWAARADPVE